MCNTTVTVPQTAIYQALRFNYNLTYRHIATLTQRSVRSAWSGTNGLFGVKKWEDRTKKEQELAKTEAHELIRKELITSQGIHL